MGLSRVIVAMITSNVTRAVHPSRILIRRTCRIGRQSGVLTDAVLGVEALAGSLALEPAKASTPNYQLECPSLESCLSPCTDPTLSRVPSQRPAGAVCAARGCCRR